MGDRSRLKGDILRLHAAAQYSLSRIVEHTDGKGGPHAHRISGCGGIGQQAALHCGYGGYHSVFRKGKHEIVGLLAQGGFHMNAGYIQRHDRHDGRAAGCPGDGLHILPA